MSPKVQLTRKYYHSHPRLDHEILTRLIGKLSNQKHCHFVQRLIKEIKEPFEQLQFWIQFKILDPRNLPKSKDQLISYGNEKLMQLLTHYGSSIRDVFQGNEKYINT